MEAKGDLKAKRHKKRKSRTQVASDSESEYEVEPKPTTAAATTSEPPKPSSKPQATPSAFTSFYMQQATKEFAEDLDGVRGAGDFKAEALSILVQALQQGTTLFSEEEQRRILSAGAGQA
ncbi:putative ribosome assembly protein 3 [Amylocarpus encephaloides]|uniref:Ribosome assembly protein 3 n=1 Tax=Amylocarpus encephaloides TaxID=45428 RepID=A0A9P8C180_9HELO|nr:putative ribosome assembly protein 3 [Amylocarpus encephaloides]